jgi:dipeptidyl aminopeptidase/acylaminoacyl peptidase
MRNKEVYFKSDNLNLYGVLYSPDILDPAKPALCLCHGIPAVPYNPKERGYALLAEKFCVNGFITFIFNFRGAGLSQGNLDLLGWTHDLQAAVNFLYSLDELKKAQLALIGFSGGAAVSVYVAAQDARIASIVTLACPASFDFLPGNKADAIIAHFRTIGVIRDKDFPESVEKWLEGFNTVSPLSYIEQISPRPLLIVHGDKDDTVPVMHAHKLYQKAREPRELIIIPNAGHRLRLEEKAVDSVLNWLLNIADN